MADIGAPVYDFTQLEQLWQQAGGSRATSAIAAAIALAESSGEPAVTSSNPDGGINVGLWQLDTRGKGAGYSAQQLTDPLTNARAAVAGSSNGRDWSAWETYVTGAYKRFMHGQAGPGTPPATTGGGVFSWPGQIVGAFTSAGQAIDWLVQPSNWVRIFAFGFGLVAMLAGVFMLSHVGGH